MNPPSRVGRLIVSARLRFNNIDVRKFGLGLAFFSLVIMWLLIGSVYLPAQYELKAGDIAPDLIRAPRTLTFENKSETERRQQKAADEVARVYSFDPAVLPRISKNLGTYFDGLNRAIDEQAAAAKAANQPADPAMAAKRLQEQQSQPSVSAASLTVLAGLDPARLAELRKIVEDSFKRIMEGNVTDASLTADRSRLRALISASPLTAAEQDAAAELAAAFIEPNNIYNSEKTEQARQQAAANVQPDIVTVRNGETILAPGQLVTGDHVVALQALGLSGQKGKYGTLAGIALMIIIELVVAAAYIQRFEQRVRGSRALLFIAASLLVLFTALERIAAVAPLSPLIVPMAALGMLGTLMLKTRLAAVLVVMANLNMAMIGGSDPQYIMVGLLGGLSGVFLVTNVSQRRDLLRAGLWATVVVTAAAMGASQISESSWSRFFAGLAWGLGNGTLTIVATVALITIYEMVFNLPTPLKLLELADPTRPLLKELMMKAPGTYNHSILMGNIAESAAEAIGANPLLARVGAYYHDIGKLNRPDYFIENQFHVKNPHDRLTPNLSRLAITAHVRDGVRLAREEGLPPEVVDIIKQHHGTTVLSYFYHKAKERAGGETVDEEAYRYAGEKPTSREAAIVALADSVEAAVRALPNPTIKNIKTIISEIFSQRLRDGQLSESQMVFGDLEKVRQVFVQSLRGFGATRIAYPSKRESEGGQPRSRPPKPQASGGAST